MDCGAQSLVIIAFLDIDTTVLGTVIVVNVLSVLRMVDCPGLVTGYKRRRITSVNRALSVSIASRFMCTLSSSPLTQGPLSHGPLSEGLLSPGPLSHGPLSHSPLSQGPLSQGPLSQDC